MSRKKIIWSDNKVNQFIKEGRGQGEGAKYIPWLKVGDFSSLGRCHRIKDTRNGRTHHFFSDLEKNYYYYLFWNEDIIDIREQYPLFPVFETEEIANKLGIKHPQYNGFNTVMTTDILFTTFNKMYARSLKMSTDISKQRIREKLEIEKVYWDKRGIDFKVVTEKSFSRVVARNVEKLFGYYEFPFKNMDMTEQTRLSEELIKNILMNENKTVSEICMNRDVKENMKSGCNLNLFFHLASRKIIPINIENSILPTKKIKQIINMDLLKRMEAKVFENLA